MNDRKGTPIFAQFALLAASTMVLSAGCGEEVIATYTEVFDASEIGELVADFDDGELVIEGQRGRTDVELRADLIGWGPRAFHDDAKDAVRLGWEDVDEDTARVVAELAGDYDDDSDHGHYRLDVRLRVPAEVYLDLSHGSGDALVAGVKAVHMDDESGDLEILDIETNAVVNDDSGDLALVRIGGSAFVHDESGDVLISGVSGSVEVKDDSGDIEARNVMGTVRVWDESGDIDIINAAGVVIERDTSGDVDIR